MAMREEDRLLKLFAQLPANDRKSTLDFIEFLANRQTTNFFTNLDEVDEPFSKEELQQMEDTEFVSLDEVVRDLGWNDGDHLK